MPSGSSCGTPQRCFSSLHAHAASARRLACSAPARTPTTDPNCRPQAAPDPGMAPRRCTRERTKGPTDLHLSAPASIDGAAAGSGLSTRLRRAVPLNPLEPQYAWCPVRAQVECFGAAQMPIGWHTSLSMCNAELTCPPTVPAILLSPPTAPPSRRHAPAGAAGGGAAPQVCEGHPGHLRHCGDQGTPAVLAPVLGRPARGCRGLPSAGHRTKRKRRLLRETSGHGG